MSEYDNMLRKEKKMIDNDATGYISGFKKNEDGRLSAIYVVKLSAKREKKIKVCDNEEKKITYKVNIYSCKNIIELASGKRGKWSTCGGGEFTYGGDDIKKYKTKDGVREFIATVMLSEIFGGDNIEIIKMEDEDVKKFEDELWSYNNLESFDDEDEDEDDDYEDEDDEDEDEDEECKVPKNCPLKDAKIFGINIRL